LRRKTERDNDERVPETYKEAILLKISCFAAAKHYMGCFTSYEYWYYSIEGATNEMRGGFYPNPLKFHGLHAWPQYI
jgi:hypothetical protein